MAMEVIPMGLWTGGLEQRLWQGLLMLSISLMMMIIHRHQRYPRKGLCMVKVTRGDGL